MKNCLAALLLAGGLATSAPAALVITEINSGATGGDFWELTNAGDLAVDLSNWTWTDSTGINIVPIPAGTSIASGESIIFAVEAPNFRTVWNLSNDVQVIVSDNPGLGGNDAVKLSDQNAVLQLSLSYAAGGFTQSSGALAAGGAAGISAGGSLNTQSMIIDPTFGIDSPRYTFATGVNFGTFANTSGQFGSPGYSGITPVPEPGTVALVAVGLGFFGWQYGRRRCVRA